MSNASEVMNAQARITFHPDYANTGRDYVSYKCPCPMGEHRLPVSGSKRPKWSFDGNLEKPTISPSINSWTGPSDNPKKIVCHHFVRNGRIEFCGDSTHELAGKTIDMEPIS